MSVLLVTDDADDEISPYEYLYQQINVYQINRSYSLIISIDKSSSNIVDSKSCRRRRACRLKSLVISMLTLLFIVNHLHWSIVFLSLSSLKMMSTYALTPLATRLTRAENNPQCFLINRSSIDRLCSRTCHATAGLLKPNEDESLQTYSLSFCSMLIINQTYLFNETNEEKCRDFFHQLISADDEARMAMTHFTTYMQAIDSGSVENPFASINSDCQQAYRMWSCSVKIPFYHRSQRILPCQTICDEVERVCPTLRPSDREPLFAGQPLFFCSGGIVANSDYAQRPYCFDKYHLTNGSLKRHSVSSSSSDMISISPVAQFFEDMILTPPCFDIQLSPTTTEFTQSSALSIVDSQFNETSLSASTISRRSSSILLICFLSMISLEIKLDSSS